MNNKINPKHLTIKGFRPESNDFPTKKVVNARLKLKEAKEYVVEAQTELEEAITDWKNQENKNPERKSVHKDKKAEESKSKLDHNKKRTSVEKSFEIDDLGIVNK